MKFQSYTYKGEATGAPWGADAVGFSITELEEMITSGNYSSYEGIYITDTNPDITKISNFSKKSSTKHFNLYGCKKLTTLDDHALSETNFSSIILPPSLTYISDYAFYDNPNLETITIPELVTYIGEFAFYDCYNLTNVDFSLCTIENLKQRIFFYCQKLSSIKLPETLTKIENGAFADCTTLTSIHIPDSVTSIGEYAFENDFKLETINIPSSLTFIDSNAFASCPIKNVYIPSTKTWCNIEFKNPFANPLRYSTVEHIYINGIDTTDIVLDNTVTEIKDYAFLYCKVIKSITIPESVTSIGQYAFECCSNLSSVTVPSSVTEIGNGAFCEIPLVIYDGPATGAPWGAKKVQTSAE